VIDERLAANFGDIERNGEPVATPLWIATGVKTASGEEIDPPAVHAQLRVHVRGETVNGDVTFYGTLDIAGTGGGGTAFREDVTGDQPWVGGRIAHRTSIETRTSIVWCARCLRTPGTGSRAPRRLAPLGLERGDPVSASRRLDRRVECLKTSNFMAFVVCRIDRHPSTH
jgi:hypothetical protein